MILFSRTALSCLLLTLLSACVTAEAKTELTCTSPGNWMSLPTGKTISNAEATAELSKAQVVLLGETHTRAEQHQWQLHTLAALYGQNQAIGVGFEMFPRSSQAALDRWIKGMDSRSRFLELSEWDRVWQYDSKLYSPLLDFVRQNKIPSFGINVDRSLIREVSQKGWEAVDNALKEGVSAPAPALTGYKTMLFKVYQEHLSARGKNPQEAKKEDESFQRFVQSQLTWDRAMAQKLAEMLAAEKTDQVVGLIGSGHLTNGFGVAHQLKDLGVTEIAIAIPVDKNFECFELQKDMADLIFVTEPLEEVKQAWKPLLGVMLEPAKDGVRISGVLEKSVAKKAGLKKGDIFKKIAGIEVYQVKEAIKIVQRQAPGTWLPLEMNRDGKTLTLIAKFPSAK